MRHRRLLAAGLLVALAVPSATGSDAPAPALGAVTDRADWAPRLRSAREALDDLDARLAAAAERRWAADDELVLAGAAARLAAARRADAEAAADAAEARGAAEREAFVAVAVASYVNGGPSEDVLGALDAADQQEANAEFRRRTLVRTATIVQETTASAAAEDAARAALLRRQAAAEDGTARARLAAAVAERDAAAAALDELLAQRPALVSALDRAREEERWPGTDLPGWFVGIYRAGAAHALATDPGCGMDWHLLAAIGFVESRHARFGAGMDAGGTVPAILGPPLDGVTVPAAIPDTDAGALDGDPVWERAVGPMQFLPGTWRSFGADGNGDGVADPNNVWDATAAAADYLCATRRGADVRTPEGFAAAIRAYNPSDRYARAVGERMRGYRAAEAAADGWSVLHAAPVETLVDRDVVHPPAPAVPDPADGVPR